MAYDLKHNCLTLTRYLTVFLFISSRIKICSANHTATIDLSQALRLKDMLNIFDVQQLAANWHSVRSELGANCSSAMRSYFEGLKGGALWAAKSKYPDEV